MIILDNYKTKILEGTFISIDPSVGSGSSMPAWALYKQGKLVESGKWKIELDQELADRCRDLHGLVTALIKETTPLLVVVEKITAGGRFKRMDSLLKGVGAIMVAASPLPVLEISPRTWQTMKPDDYYKSDEQDAIAIGYYVVETSKGNSNGSKETPGTSRLRSLRQAAPRRSTRNTRATRKKLVRRRPRGKSSSSVRKKSSRASNR